MWMPPPPRRCGGRLAAWAMSGSTRPGGGALHAALAAVAFLSPRSPHLPPLRIPPAVLYGVGRRPRGRMGSCKTASASKHEDDTRPLRVTDGIAARANHHRRCPCSRGARRVSAAALQNRVDAHTTHGEAVPSATHPNRVAAQPPRGAPPPVLSRRTAGTPQSRAATPCRGHAPWRTPSSGRAG